MIIPAGKRKEQVNQGPFKNSTFMDSCFSNTLSKSAITGMPDLNEQHEHAQPNYDPRLQDAMNSGSGNGMAGLDQMEHQNSPENMQHNNRFRNEEQQGISPYLKSAPPPQQPQQEMRPEPELQTVLDQIFRGYGIKYEIDKRNSPKIKLILTPTAIDENTGKPQKINRNDWIKIKEQMRRSLGIEKFDYEVIPGEEYSNEPVTLEYNTQNDKVEKSRK